MEKYSYFLNQIPENIINNVEKHVSTNIMLFKPKTYIENVEMKSVDYHFVFPSTPPPPTYIDDILYHFDNNVIVVFNPGETILCPKAVPTDEYLSLLIKPEIINKISHDIGYEKIIIFKNNKKLYSNNLVEEIKSFNNEARRQDKSLLLLDCIGVQLVATLIREIKSNINKYPKNSPNMNASIRLAIEYINTFYSSDIRIEDICKEINISAFHFIRMFKNRTGKSPHQYLVDIRIQRAKELLSCGQYSISEISTLCGFINLSHFSSKFKEVTGLSPTSYKKKYFQIKNWTTYI